MDINNPPTWLIVLLSVAGAILAITMIVAVAVPLFRVVGWFVGQLLRFIAAIVTDLFRLVGMLLTIFVLSPIALANIIFGRWSRAEHYGRALSAEGSAILMCLYRLAIGHPLRLFNAQGVVEGLEQRVPQVVAHAPPPTELPTLPVRAREAGVSRAGQFPGYTILGTLPGGGSGGRLYIARPDAQKLAQFQRIGFGSVGDVVIKSFGLSGPGGSTLPQIVRENRALEAAKKMGLVLEHELTNDRFFYIMRYVPGDSLGLVAQRLHAASGSGLTGKPLADAIGYVADLVGTLADYHHAGLWHKDVKPDNIIVAGGHAHLVDFGLVTPLRSSMTLTTHGTEYFRDPELVRLALKGVKVHEVDGARFDLYAAGAVLFSVIENSFPAHGGLSQLSKPCPEAVKWIVRRAMTDYDKRYPTALAMLADLRLVQRAAAEGRLESLRPADLPSVAEGDSVTPAPIAPIADVANHTPPPSVGRFQGRAPSGAAVINAAASPVPPTPAAARRSARDQLHAAQTRVAERQRRASERMNRGAKYSLAPKASATGILIASIVFVGGIIGISLLTRSSSSSAPSSPVQAAIEDARASVAAAESAGALATADAEAARAQLESFVKRVQTEARELSSAVKSGLKSVPGSPRSTRTLPPDVEVLGPASGAGTNLLILQEPAQIPADAADTIAARLNRLDELGFTLSGSASLLAPAAQSSPESAGELEADLRRAVGLRVLPGPEAKAAIAAWLRRQNDIDGVLWLVRDPDSPDSLLQWFIPSEDFDDEALSALRSVLGPSIR
jgi:serine/threonine protein kinase